MLFLTWDPFTLVLNYSNPCKCFSYKYLSCFLMCDKNFYDRRITIISLVLSENLYSSFDKRNSECFANIPFTQANMNHCPHFKGIEISPFKWSGKRKFKSYLGISYKHRKRMKFWKWSVFSIIKYTLCYAIDEISLRIFINELFSSQIKF